MKEILFRGKTTDNSKWIYGSLIQAKDYCCILEDEDDDLGTIDGKATPVIPETVGQYIGITDCRCNRIFEGDILESKLKRTPDKLGALIIVSDIRNCKNIWLLVSQYFVTGNIFDNPELNTKLGVN